MLRLLFSGLLLLTTLPVPVLAQHALGGAGPYDPAVPTPEAVLGYPLGARFTPHHLIVRYAEAVAESSPRVRLDTVARSFEGRPVLLATVTSEANQRRLPAIRSAAARLAAPGSVDAGELARLEAETPTIVWLGYTIHGNEGSGVEAALATLYQLAAGQDADTRMILDSVVVLIDPAQNPDGHERHVENVTRALGALGPDPYPAAMVNSSGWPGARTSHYLFDLNRDWFIQSHPESRGRAATFEAWHPHVAVDLHEMGSSSTYFFAPPMPPYNPNVEASIPKWWGIFARANADAMAAHGWGFFHGEAFDEFYPGYGVSWPTLTGAVGMTYEEASSEGGAIRRDDGTILTLREAARHHYTTSMATLEASAQRRAERVRDYVAFRRSAVTDGARSAMRTVVLEPDAQGRADSLVRVLRGNGIEVGRLDRPTSARATAYGHDDAGRVELPEGAWVIDLAQPEGRLARAILEPNAALPDTFITSELEARRQGRRDRFYDITAWSLPFTYRVGAWWTGDRLPAVEAADDDGAAGVPAPAEAGYAYLFEPGSEASLRLLAALLSDSIRVRHAPRSFRVGGIEFPHGAFVVLVNRNTGAAPLHDRIAALAAAAGARVVAVDNALVETGTDLGSNSVVAIPQPRVALVGGEGTSAYSYGAAWYVFDQLLRFPATRIELGGLARSLPDFNVVVMPSANGLGASLGEDGVAALRRWVRGGGTLITLDAATAWAASDDGLGRLRRKPRPETAEDGGEPLPESVPGAIVRAAVDTLSPLLAGVTTAEIPVMLSGDRVYRAPDDVRPGEVAVRYAAADRLRLSGYVWPEVPERVAGTPYLWTERVGRGRLVAFAGDPNFRMLWRGLLPLFANAVFLGGSY